MPGLIATKVGMSRIFQPDGTAVPVTYLKVEPSIVVGKRTKEQDGYCAIVLGVPGKKWKTRKGREHIRYRKLKEFPVESLEGVEVGSHVAMEVFSPESLVTVVGISKGKGFAGVIKRHHFSSGPGSHGSHQHREPGSIGCRAKPGKVHRGKRMPGRMGHERVTLKHRLIVASDPSGKVLAVKGAVPGPRRAHVFLVLEAKPS